MLVFKLPESVKLCNNLALAIQMIGTSEALSLVRDTNMGGDGHLEEALCTLRRHCAP
jgi:hypothetical protein